MRLFIYFGILYVLALLSCTPDETPNDSNSIPVVPPHHTTSPISTPVNPGDTINYLALGDSYTIGQSVCATCSFPAQLKDSLVSGRNPDIILKIIATTGWTTTDLKKVVDSQPLKNNYDLVTLLIGVNNQYQKKPFSLYQKEFPELLDKAISLAKGDPNNVIVLSIPDYAYTPYGQSTSDPSAISIELSNYNSFAETICNQKGAAFVDITPITRDGLTNPGLVAADGLHPSESAYSKFVTLILPKSIAALRN